MITSSYLSGKLSGLLMRGEPYPKPQIFLGLLNTVPTTPSGVWVEASGGSYRRIQIISSDMNWDITNGGIISNTHDIISAIATTTHENISGIGFFDSLTGGNLLLSGSISPITTINVGFVLSFRTGELKVSINSTYTDKNNNVSLSLSRVIINHLFRSGAMNVYPYLYWGLLSEKPSTAHNDGIEVTGNGYARSPVLSHPSNWSVSDVNGMTTNTVDFGLPSGTWTDIEGVALYDSLNGGAALIIFNLDTPLHGNTSEILPIIRAGEFSFTIN